MHDELYQPKQKWRVLVEDRLFAFEKGIAYCTWIWTLTWGRDVVGVVVLVIVSRLGRPILAFICVVFFKPVAGAVVLAIPPSYVLDRVHGRSRVYRSQLTSLICQLDNSDPEGMANS